MLQARFVNDMLLMTGFCATWSSTLVLKPKLHPPLHSECLDCTLQLDRSNRTPCDESVVVCVRALHADNTNAFPQHLL